MSEILKTRSKELKKFGIITSDNKTWSHPEIELVYTREHIESDNNFEFNETIKRFCNEINCKRELVNGVTYRVEVLRQRRLYPYGLLSHFLKPVYEDYWQYMERFSKLESAKIYYDSLDPKIIEEK